MFYCIVSVCLIMTDIGSAKILYSADFIAFHHVENIFQEELRKVKSDSSSIFQSQMLQNNCNYSVEELNFINQKDSVRLTGTLTIPDSVSPIAAVILISGSLPVNRDYESFHHRPFFVLADYLTRRGIAVLRYDSRGAGMSSGDFFQSTPLDFAQDIEAGIRLLKTREELKGKKIGLIGHSGGGLVAAIAGSQQPDVDFIVLLATPAIKVKDVFLEQIAKDERSLELQDLMKRFYTSAYDLIEDNLSTNSLADTLQSSYKYQFIEYFRKNPGLVSPEYLFKAILRHTLTPYNQFCVKCDPSDFLEKITCPVLSLNGSSDLKVNAGINQDAIRRALMKAENKNTEIVELERLNHSFQECERGTVVESKTLEQSFSSIALELIFDWIWKTVK